MVIVNVAIFIALVVTYYNLCTNREVSKTGKVAEIISLYSISIWALMSNVKFIFWAIGIAVIGVIKILTTKKENIGRQSKGVTN